MYADLSRAATPDGTAWVLTDGSFASRRCGYGVSLTENSNRFGLSILNLRFGGNESSLLSASLIDCVGRQWTELMGIRTGCLVALCLPIEVRSVVIVTDQLLWVPFMHRNSAAAYDNENLAMLGLYCEIVKRSAIYARSSTSLNCGIRSSRVSTVIGRRTSSLLKGGRG